MSDYFHYQYVERDDDGNLRPLPASPYLLPAAILGGCLWGLGKLLDWANKPEPLKLDELQLVEYRINREIYRKLHYRDWDQMTYSERQQWRQICYPSWSNDIFTPWLDYWPER